MSAWLYFLVTEADGSPRLIVRRNGPFIELLTTYEGRIDRPQLFTRFHDPGYLEPLTK